MEHGSGFSFGARIEGSEPREVYEKRMLRHSRIRTVCAVMALAIVCVAFFAAADAMVRVNGIMVSLGAVAVQVEDADVAGMLHEIRQLVNGAKDTLDTTADGMNQTIKKIESIDIDALNAAIRDLAAVVEPLARFFGR